MTYLKLRTTALLAIGFINLISFTAISQNDSLLKLSKPISDPANGNSVPEIIHAEASDTDLWFPYKTRLVKDSKEAQERYPKEILDKIPQLNYTNPNLVPWSFKGIPSPDKEIYPLKDIIADKVVDQTTGKTYSLLYHGTTSDLLDVFKQGASAIRFDVAANTVLGMGFYMSASANEAKSYACMRLLERKQQNPNLQGMLVVIGVEDNEMIKGKASPHIHLSDNKTGAPLDPDIYFKRKAEINKGIDNRYNQASFFSNIAPYLKIFSIVLLPRGFGRANWVQDYDGYPDTASAYKIDPNFKCNY